MAPAPLFNPVAGNATLTDITVVDERPGAPDVHVGRNPTGQCASLV